MISIPALDLHHNRSILLFKYHPRILLHLVAPGHAADRMKAAKRTAMFQDQAEWEQIQGGIPNSGDATTVVTSDLFFVKTLMPAPRRLKVILTQWSSILFGAVVPNYLFVWYFILCAIMILWEPGAFPVMEGTTSRFSISHRRVTVYWRKICISNMMHTGHCYGRDLSIGENTITPDMGQQTGGLVRRVDSRSWCMETWSKSIKCQY